MKAGREFTEADIGAYLDGELENGEQEAFETWLGGNPTIRERLEAYESDRRLLEAALDPVIREPVPDRLIAALGTVEDRRGPFAWWQAIAAVLLLAIGIAAGWGGATYRQRAGEEIASTPTRALNAHLVYVSEVLHPVEVASDQKDHLVAWLSKRLGHALTAPDLTDQGFRLVGGRLLPGDRGAAAQFMYEDATGLRTTLYVALNPQGRETAFRLARRGDTQTFYWLDGPFGYAITADLDEDRLLTLARSVYHQTSQGADAVR